MNCIEFQTVLDDYVDGALSAAAKLHAEEHLAHCAACRAQVASLRNLLGAAAVLPKEVAPGYNLWPAIKSEAERLAAKPVAANVARAQSRGLGTNRSALSWLLPLAAAAGIVLLATWPQPPVSRWTVASLAGAPRVGRQTIATPAPLRIGQWVETDAHSRARLAETSVGEVNIEPNSRLRLKAAANDHRLDLQRGTMSAFIWAPPRLFFVDTPAARAIDLGCAYTMSVDDDGNGELHVTLGYVALEHDGREAIIPAHAKCITRRGYGPGTPFDDDAPPALRDALQQFDFDRPAAARALPIILAHARPDDGVTLWHLLARTDGEQRIAVYDRLAHWHRPPEGVTREGILAGNRAMREAWAKAIGIGTF